MAAPHQAKRAPARKRYVSKPGPKPAYTIEIRRLPVVPMPVPGEAFASWVDRTAFTLDVPPGVAARALGLEFRTRSNGARPLFFGLTLTPASLTGLQTTTGLPADVLRKMHFARYDGTVLDLSGLDFADPTTVPRLLRYQWLLASGSRACPHCLSHSTAWPLWWRLGIAAACPIHRCLLIDTCPACGITLRRGSGYKNARGLLVRPQAALEPLECGNRPPNAAASGQPQVCRHRITDIPTAPVPDMLIDVQQRALSIAEGGTALLAGEPVSGADWFAALRFLSAAARLVVSDSELSELPSAMADALAAVRQYKARRCRSPQGPLGEMPGTAAQAAAELTLASAVLNAPNRDAGTQSLTSWARRLAEERPSRHYGGDPLRIFPRPAALEQMMTDAVPHPRRVVGAITATAPVPIEFRHIPHLIDSEDYRDLIAVHLPGTTALTGRRFSSIALARAIGAHTWDHAVTSLGMDTSRRRDVSYLVNRIPDPDAFWEAVSAAAQRMQTLGLTDYAARRTALSSLYEVPHDVLFPLFNPLGMDVTRQRQRHTAAWIWQRLTGSRAHDAPPYAGGWEGVSTRSLNGGRRRFHAALPETVAIALTSWGLNWLAEQGVE